MTTQEILVTLFSRDLVKLEKEIEAYTSVDFLWSTPKGVNNSSGNLCLHLCGNLQHYIGAVLGNSGYKRNRASEFSTNGISKEELLAEIKKRKQLLPLFCMDSQVMSLITLTPNRYLTNLWKRATFLFTFWGI
jgi:hypothetical protein